MNKVMYIDTETTGLDPIKNGLTEVYCIIVEEGVELCSRGVKINPHTYSEPKEIELEAVNIQGKSLSDLLIYQHQSGAFKSMYDFWKMESKDEKIQLVGYNIDFDVKFLKAWFAENDEDFYSIFSHRTLDVLDLVRHLQHAGVINPKDGKLTTLCVYFGIPIKAHSAAGDATATLQLHNLLLEQYITKGVR